MHSSLSISPMWQGGARKHTRSNVTCRPSHSFKSLQIRSEYLYLNYMCPRIPAPCYKVDKGQCLATPCGEPVRHPLDFEESTMQVICIWEGGGGCWIFSHRRLHEGGRNLLKLHEVLRGRGIFPYC